MHPAKRKKTGTPASALTKPFRSPLLVDSNKNKSLPEKQEKQDLQGANSVASQKASSNNQISTTSLSAATPARAPNLTRFRQGSPSPIESLSSRPCDHDQDYIDLKRQYSTLLLQHKDITASLDTTLQALKIVQSNKDKDLEILVKKWRLASREAAEELFSTAKDRVNRMGGVSAWRDNYMRSQEAQAWSADAEIDEDELSEEQKEQLEIARDEARIEAEEYGLLQTAPLANVSDDDSFTIDIMLRQLNIDLEVIGYDAEAQRWCE